MKNLTIIAIAILLSACSKDALKMADQGLDAAAAAAPVDPTPAPVAAEADSPPVVFLPYDAHPEFDFDARPEVTINRDVQRISNISDAGCPLDRAWLFVEQNDSVWCGSVLDGCEAICHSRDCTVHREANGLQTAYCPPPKKPTGP
jgi:hypothetical protein